MTELSSAIHFALHCRLQPLTLQGLKPEYDEAFRREESPDLLSNRAEPTRSK
jgi:hypothetical protein